VRCIDARVSCPASHTCTDDYKCLASDGSVIASITNVDAAQVAEFRDFGEQRSSALRLCCVSAF